MFKQIDIDADSALSREELSVYLKQQVRYYIFQKEMEFYLQIVLDLVCMSKNCSCDREQRSEKNGILFANCSDLKVS